MAQELYELGIVARLNQAALSLCQASGHWVEAEKKLKEAE